MEILLNQDIIVGFLTGKIKNKENSRLTKKIFDNEHSKFLFSKKFLQYLKTELGDEFNDEFQRFTTYLIDSGENIQSSDTTTNFDEEMVSIFQKCQKPIVFCISYSEPSEEISRSIPNIAILSNQQKLNYDWLVIKLVILHPDTLTIPSFDFNNQQQINDLFKNIFKIPKQLNKISVLDRQTRNFSNEIFCFDKSLIQVAYYTYQHRNFYSDESNIKNFFKRHLIFLTRNSTELHGRRIIFGNLVVSADHDFNELRVKGDWKIDIQFSPSDVRGWLSRCNKFRRHT